MSKYTDRIDSRFPYTPAAETAKPGYLAKRFDAIRKQQAAAKAKRDAEEAATQAERAAKVRGIKRAAQ